MTSETMRRGIAYELDLLGSHGMAEANYPQMLAIVESGILRPDLLVERTVGLAVEILRLRQWVNPTVPPLVG